MEKNVLAKETEVGQIIEQLEKMQKSCFFLEKKRSINLDYMRKAVWNKGAFEMVHAPKVEVEREFSELFTELSNEDECDHIMLKKANAFTLISENILIFIIDHFKLRGYLVGYLGSGLHSKAVVKIWAI